jgi:hypothetical protein
MQGKLWSSLVKYGPQNHKFETEQTFLKTTQEILNEREQFYIDYYRNRGEILLNIREGGSRGKFSKDTRKLMSEKAKNKKVSIEFREKCRLRMLIQWGKKKGTNVDAYVSDLEELRKRTLKPQQKNYRKGPHSKESIEKMRLSKLGKTASEETRKKLSEAQKESHRRRKLLSF